MSRRAAIYVRVSTDAQTVANQIVELNQVAERSKWEVVHTFRDEGISGAKGREQRPGLDALLLAVARREVDVVAVWSVDRLSRSLNDLLALLGEFHAKGVDLFLHQQGIDTTTPAGKAMFSMIGVFAEFERAMIRERITAGIRRARAQGRIGGRRKISAERETEVRRLIEKGEPYVNICALAKVGNSVVQRLNDEMKAEREREAAR